jgi:tetratricopeptide (TPR) repeat protein
MTRHKSTPGPERPASVKTVQKKDYTLYWLIAGLLLVVIVYFPSLLNGIGLWDDQEYLNNPYVKDLSPAGIVKIFSVYFAGNYHPLALLSLGTDRLIGGGGPFMFHFTNLLLHLVNTFLVFLLVRRLTQNNLLAIMSFILFGVHPLHVESVAWVAERKDVLYSFFFLLSLIIYTSYASRRKTLYYGLSLLFFLLSLLSKGQAVVFVAILPFIDYLKGRKWFSVIILAEKVPFFLLSLIFAWVAFRAQESAKFVHFEYVSLPERVAFASFGLTEYLVKSILPIHLSAYYPYPARVNGSIPSFYWYYIISLPVVFIGSYLLFKRSKIYALGLGVFFLCLLPLLQLIPVGGAIIADRYFYVPSVGLMLCFAFGLLELRSPAIRFALFIPFTLFLSILSFSRCTVWKDNLALWDDVLGKYDHCQVAYYNRGSAHFESKHWDRAIADYSRAIAIDPKYTDAYYNRGIIYGNSGQWDQAIADYSRAIEINPEYAQAYENRGVIYGKTGQLDKAIADCSRAIELDPENAEAYDNRGLAYGYLGQWDKAITDYSRAIEIDAKSAQAYDNRGVAYLNLRQLDPAIADYSNAIRIDPDNAKAYNDRGFTYSLLKQYENAAEDYSKAIEIDPNYTDAYSDRGIAYINLGQWDKAIADFSSVIEINPKDAKAYYNRGYAYGNLGRWDKAIADFTSTIGIDPTFTAAYQNREIAYNQLHKREKP